MPQTSWKVQASMIFQGTRSCSTISAQHSQRIVLYATAVCKPASTLSPVLFEKRFPGSKYGTGS